MDTAKIRMQAFNIFFIACCEAEYVAPDGAEIRFGLISTNISRLRRWQQQVAFYCTTMFSALSKRHSPERVEWDWLSHWYATPFRVEKLTAADPR
jgi:hypothetical protein